MSLVFLHMKLENDALDYLNQETILQMARLPKEFGRNAEILVGLLAHSFKIDEA